MEFNTSEFEQELYEAMGADAAGITVDTSFASSVSGDIRRAIDAIENATTYIGERMCPMPARPTKIVLNLTAGFELVFSAQTGSQIEWDLEIVCPRVEP